MTSKQSPLPVFGGIGNREIIGFASSVAQATSLIKRHIDIAKGFTLAVWRRDAFIQELLEVPDGYVFSVSYKFGPSSA